MNRTPDYPRDITSYKPRYANPIPKKEYGVFWFSLMVIAGILLSLYVLLHPQTEKAQAAEVSRFAPEILDQKKAACAFAQLYPEKVRNVKESLKDCS